MKAKELILDYKGRRPDIGAFDQGLLIEGIPFRYATPNAILPYKELPRITRMKIQNDELRIWFSLPMDDFSLKAIARALLYDGERYPLNYLDLSDDGYCLTLTGENLPAVTEPSELQKMELKLSKWPQAMQGKKLTSWASEIKVSLY